MTPAGLRYLNNTDPYMGFLKGKSWLPWNGKLICDKGFAQSRLIPSDVKNFGRFELRVTCF